MKFVCPVPMKWSDIHQTLCKAHEESGLNCPPPPMPLILGGWIYSGDLEKNLRWNSTIEWAIKYGFEYLLPQLEPDDMYSVEEYGYPNIDYRGLYWDLKVKEKPEPLKIIEYLAILQNRWDGIAGPLLSDITFPKKFTGRKKRRLLVAVVKHSSSPWGEWNRIRSREGITKFREFRRKINESIYPHAVDHVDFVEVEKIDFS